MRRLNRQVLGCPANRATPLAGADRSTAAAVTDLIPDWINHCNGVVPHSALGYRAPKQYRQLLQDGQPTSVAGPKERTVRS